VISGVQKKTYESAMALRLKHENPGEYPELLVNYGNTLAKECRNSKEEMERAAGLYERAMKCERCICGPFQDPTKNELLSRPDNREKVADSLNQIHRHLLLLEQKAEKSSSSRQSQIAKRLQAKLSQRSSQSKSVMQAALDCMETDSSPSASASASASAPADTSWITDDESAKLSGASKKNKKKSRKPAKPGMQVQVEPGNKEDADGLPSQAEAAPVDCQDSSSLAEDGVRSAAQWQELLEQRVVQVERGGDDRLRARVDIGRQVRLDERVQDEAKDLRH